MPDAPRPPGTGGGGNVHRAWAQRGGDRRVFPPPPPPPLPLRRPPHGHGAADSGRRGEGGGSSGAGARGYAGEEAGARWRDTKRGGVADREVAGGASADPAGRNAATVVAAGGEAPPPPPPTREESGGGGVRDGGVGSKRPSAPPTEHPPPPKRRAVSATRQLPPASRWTAAAAPAPLAGADADAGSRTRYDGDRENRGSGALEKPAVARPLAARKDGAGVLSRAVPPNAAGTRVVKKPYATDGAAPDADGSRVLKKPYATDRAAPAPMANTGRHGPRAGMVKSSAKLGRGRGAGTDELSGKKVPVTATRLPPKPEIISATRTSLPGRGKDVGFSSKVHRPWESGRAHGGSAVPMKVLTVDDHSSLADGRAVQIGVAARTGASVGAVQKDVKVTNKYGESSNRYNTVPSSSAKDSSKENPMRKIVIESGRMNRRASSDVAAGVSGEGNVLTSKDMFPNQNTVKPAKVVQKFVRDTQRIPLSRDKKETVRGRRVTTNGIQDSVELTRDRVMQAPMSPDMCPMTNKKKAAATSDFLGHPRLVKPKALGHQQRKIASTSVSGSKGKLDDEVASNLKFDDIFLDIDFREGNLELRLNSSSGLPSVRCQRQYRYSNADARSRFKMLCRMFEFICRTIARTKEQRSLKMRVDFVAAEAMKKKLSEFIQHDRFVGKVPGVKVGDEFLYRSQLAIAGLHHSYRKGIDTTRENGMLIAISIVASGGYPDELDCSGELIYTGSGGKPAGKKKDEDQELKRGNLALQNSINTKTPVRMIYGLKCRNTEGGSHSGANLVSRYIYDGLYSVEEFWMDGQAGSRVFKYKLKKKSGQPELPMHKVNRLKTFKSRPGLCMSDISQGKEATPICVINTVDAVRPAPFKYTTRIRYPFRLTEKQQGCDCTNGCSDSVSCACAVKNGGEIPFDLNGTILNEKSVIFECGPSCKCPSSCHNRVSQHDMKIPLEVFRTTKTGWGVRSLRSIPSGSFICEYIGELLHQKEADKRRNNSYLFDVGLNYDDENARSGLLSNVSGLNSSSSCSQTMEDVHFTIDAS